MIEQIITSSVLIIAIWIVSLLAEKRIDPCIRYALWLLVAMKLLIPLPEFESAVSVMNAANKIEERSVRYFFSDDGIAPDDQAVQGNKTPDRVYDYGQMANMENWNGKMAGRIGFADICLLVWLVGVLSFAGVFLWSNLRFAGKVRNDRVKIGRMKDKLDVYLVSGIKGPCLFGFFKPSIYLKKGSGLSEEQRKFVLVHEYTHYKHGDHVWALVRCVCIILYWYHPLVWLAAYRSIKDSELACDAGTLRIIGDEKRIEYGKTLIEMAKGMANASSGIPVLGCSTSAAGGMKEMKKRMRMIVDRPRMRIAALLVLAAVCVCIVGCTFGAAVSEEDAADENNAANESHDIDESDTEAVDEQDVEIAETKPYPEQENTADKDSVFGVDDMLYEDVILYNQSKADKVCIRLEPSVLRDYAWYYYIPEGRDQEWLQNFMDDLPVKGIPRMGSLEGMKETGWQIAYQGQRFMVFEGGYLYDSDGEGADEYWVEAPKLCDYIQIMLQEQLEYDKFDPADIKNIVQAKLDVCSIFTSNEYCSQTITDEETLKMFEGWFSNAEYILGGAACGNEDACLELTLADGEKVRLSIAIDSCSNFGINGIYYDYRPAPVWDNREFFACFDEIPFEWE